MLRSSAWPTKFGVSFIRARNFSTFWLNTGWFLGLEQLADLCLVELLHSEHRGALLGLELRQHLGERVLDLGERDRLGRLGALVRRAGIGRAHGQGCGGGGASGTSDSKHVSIVSARARPISSKGASLRMYWAAPWVVDSSTVCRFASEVSMTTTQSGLILFNARSVSMPSIMGMLTSSSTKSGFSRS